MKKNIKYKENKKKKKKSILRKIIKFIFIVILLGIIGYGCWFGYKYYKLKSTMGEIKVDPLSATALGIDPQKLKSIGRINILILGESGVGDGYKLADSIMIASYDPQSQQASILSIPRDTYIGKRDKNTASSNYLASYKMNAAYRNGTNIKETIECVSNLTGVNIDYYVLIDTDAIIEIVDAIGGVYFNVPIDMDYDDPTQNLHIHLKAGNQLIDGNKAEQLLRFRHNNDFTTYPFEYGDNDLGRMRTQREFMQETAKQLLKLENVTKILNLIDIAKNNVRTDMDLNELKYYIPYIFKFNVANIQTDTLPGESEKCNEVWIYIANKKKTKELVDKMFYTKIEKEDDNTNTISNTISNNTSNSVSNKINVELLNGTGDSQALTKVVKKLEAEGYNVKKAGTTTDTSKTMIINRTNNSTRVVNEIKDILGVGTTSSGTNNSNVDFTIILGKDYK